jgi:competence protein ComEC
LKVAHHGSRSSSTGAFLEKARPEIAVYSVSLDNEYGYPAREVLMALEGVGAKVFGTDIYGTVVVTSYGYGYTIQVAKEDQLEAPQTGTVP